MNYEGAEQSVLLTLSDEGAIVIQTSEGFSKDEVMEMLEATLMMLRQEAPEEQRRRYGGLH